MPHLLNRQYLRPFFTVSRVRPCRYLDTSAKPRATPQKPPVYRARQVCTNYTCRAGVALVSVVPPGRVRRHGTVHNTRAAAPLAAGPRPAGGRDHRGGSDGDPLDDRPRDPPFASIVQRRGLRLTVADERLDVLQRHALIEQVRHDEDAERMRPQIAR